ncbi:phospholipase A1 PLIP1, chloroplastic [Senna tora]|uniref:Phospholipase A1 PLIP1, chloroplastic n=1 Tax=Senna tora TaxID=362788 RepID=A0A834TQ84_9FABA|nr:phospholipase A1 PLIP1, chloroplastic [Senna tora]
MAYAAVSIPTYTTAASATMDIGKDPNALRRSSSGKDLSKMRRSYSENHLCHGVTAVEPKLKSSRSMGFFPFQLSAGSILPNLVEKEKEKEEMMMMVNIVEEDKIETSGGEGGDVKRANWVERLLEINRQWRNKIPKENMICDGGDQNYDEECDCEEGDGVCNCMVGYEEEEEEEEIEEEGVAYDSDSFSKFLVRVPLCDTKHYSQLAFLCNMAYVIPQIKAKDLRRYYGLQLVTSSLEKKAEEARLEQDSTRVPTSCEHGSHRDPPLIQPSAAYEIAASAASYVQSRAKGLLSLASSSNNDQEGRADREVEEEEEEAEEGGSSSRVYKSEVAAYVAASTMTAVVAAGEKEKQEAAEDLQSPHSSPCEWFVCDDSATYTRCFVIQGSDSLASWQANLFFEPTKFEGTDVVVHRGIYEAAKGIYEQFMPEIMEHLTKHGARAKLQFTGHSLGGSLSLLVHLMLLKRKVVTPSTLRPVVTFGSPFVFCGGRKILNQLGLEEESHIHCVMMHRDIVPRAFSCNYPNHVALLLKRLNGSFRSHPCLTKSKLLYSPLGKMLILQPDEKTSPAHPLLPSGSALYALDSTRCGYSPSVLRAFLNRPHPLQTLSHPTAYGSEGTILRDHDSSNYLKALNGVLRQHTKRLFPHLHIGPSLPSGATVLLLSLLIRRHFQYCRD